MSKTVTGTVQWYSEGKGYGFIRTTKSDHDIFVHYSAIRGDGDKTLTKGQSVTFDLIDGPKMRQAVNVIRN